MAVKMVLARGMDILAYKKFPEDDGIMADLRWKKRMPVRDDLRLVTLEYSDSEKLLDAERDILALVKGLNRLFNLSGAIPPFVVATAVEGEFLMNFLLFFLKKL